MAPASNRWRKAAAAAAVVVAAAEVAAAAAAEVAAPAIPLAAAVVAVRPSLAASPNDSANFASVSSLAFDEAALGGYLPATLIARAGDVIE